MKNEEKMEEKAKQKFLETLDCWASPMPIRVRNGEEEKEIKRSRQSLGKSPISELYWNGEWIKESECDICFSEKIGLCPYLDKMKKQKLLKIRITKQEIGVEISDEKIYNNAKEIFMKYWNNKNK